MIWKYMIYYVYDIRYSKYREVDVNNCMIARLIGYGNEIESNRTLSLGIL